jgi:hypothetical protein
MKSIFTSLVFLLAGASVVPAIAAAQAASTAKAHPATYITSGEIKANLNLAPGAAVNVQPNIRVVDVGGYNVAIGSLRSAHRSQSQAAPQVTGTFAECVASHSTTYLSAQIDVGLSAASVRTPRQRRFTRTATSSFE